MTRRTNNPTPESTQGSFYDRDYSRHESNAPEPASDRGLSDDYYGTTNNYQQTHNQSYSNYGSAPPVGMYNPERPYGSQNYTDSSSGYPPQNQSSSYYPPNQSASYPQSYQSQQRYGSDDPANFNNRPINPEEDERGLMGALAGAGAGGYAGHKMNHGFIGTLGGAYAGHKLQEAYKHHHDQQTAPHQQYPPPPQISQQQHYQNQPRNPAGNFAASSTSIEVRPGQDPELVAQAKRVDGSLNHSALFLNEVLGNNDGHFVWQRDGGFGHSAREVHVVEGGRLLRAELRDCRGEWRRSEIWLDERITNSDGQLKVDW